MKTWEDTYSLDACSGPLATLNNARSRKVCENNAKYWITSINEWGILSLQYCEEHLSAFDYFYKSSKEDGWRDREVFLDIWSVSD